MYKGTWSDLMMHISLLLMFMLSRRHIVKHITGMEDFSVPYICTWSHMVQVGNVVLIVFSLAHNYFDFYLEFGCYQSNRLHGTSQVITSKLLKLRSINNG